MKKLLLSSILMLGSLSSFAQDDCTTPLDATEGTNTAPAVTGTWEGACFDVTLTDAGDPMAGLWYSFTPVSDGEVNINSNLLSNVAPNSVDTMVSIMTGTCGALTCVASNDDVSGTNFLSNVTFPVAAGVTYYIEWSNYWDGAGFDFDLTFTPISCLGIYEVNLPTNTTTTSITLNWVASLSNPASYEIEYGPVGFTPGTGSVVTSTENTVTITGLTADTVYDYYMRSNCGATQSSWTTVDKFTTAKLTPELAGFDNNTQLTGWTTAGNGAYGLGTTAANAQGGVGQYWIFNNTVGAASNNWLFSPAFSLQAGETVTISFWERNAPASGLRSMRVTAGTTPTVAGQTTIIYSNAALSNNAYTQITTPTFIAPSAGIYYFGFNDNSGPATTAAATTMRFDTVNFTSVLGTNDFLSSKFSVFPNPVNNVINFSNDQNAVVSTVEMTDLNGRTIKSMKVNATEGQISVSDLATGMYMMKITTDQGIAVKKIVKQ